MRTFAASLWLFSSQAALAHHTRDHLMLSEEAGQVIAATRESSAGVWGWVVWTSVIVLLLLGFVRWWKGRT